MIVAQILKIQETDIRDQPEGQKSKTASLDSYLYLRPKLQSCLHESTE